MSAFDIFDLRNNSVAYVHRMRDEIWIDPPYQRQGAIWSTDKKRLLIDSLLNNFDIPKIYLHEHTTPLEVNGRRIRYSIIDGRQRLESIWGYLDGDFALAQDFELIEDGSTAAAGLTFSELQAKEPRLAALLTSISLPVMIVKTDDIELIEDMFSRLNEAVPLNAAEKRNGRGGALRPVISELVEHPFFAHKLPFDNKRYRRHDLALKFLLWTSKGAPSDAKKRQLDDFWDENKDSAAAMARLKDQVKAVLDAMTPIFEDQDKLLASVGMVSIYYLSIDRRLRSRASLPTRSTLAAFNRARDLTPFENEDLLPKEQRDYLEFDSLAQRQTDESALRFRLDVLDRFIDAHA